MLNTQQDPSALRPSVYPIPYGVTRAGAELFSEFSNAELVALRAGNLATLPDGSPERYLLEGHARADLPQNGPRLDAYQAGAALGIAILRYRLRALSEDGFVPTPLAFDPQSAPVFDSRPKGVGGKLLGQLFRLCGMPAGEVSGYDVYSRPTKFFDVEESIGLVGLLKAAWIERGQDFMKAENTNNGDDDFVSLGLGDALALYAGLHGYTTHSVERPLELRYNSRKHFLKERKQTNWRAGGYINWDRLGTNLLHSDMEISQIVGKRRVQAGYKATVRCHKLSKPNGKVRPAKLRADVWWNNTVPIGSTITDVRRFESTRVFDDDYDTSAIAEVGIKESLKTYHLGKQDRLIVMDPTGLFASLSYPFRVDGRLSDGRKDSVHLLRLCRDGSAIDLVDYQQLPQLALQGMDMLTEQALAEQRTPSGVSRLGKLALNGIMTRRKVMPGAIAASFVGAFVPENANYALTTSLAAAATVYGLARASRMINLARRDKTEQQLLLVSMTGKRSAG